MKIKSHLFKNKIIYIIANLIYYKVMNLDENLDISTLRKCIDYFLEKKDFEKAIHLYIRSGQYEDVIIKYIITISNKN